MIGLIFHELRSFAASIIHDPHAAEDAAQDAWVALLRRGVDSGFELGAHPGRDLGPWLRTVVRRRRIDGLRRAGGHELRPQNDLAEYDADSPSERSSGDGEKRVSQALEAMPHHYRTVLEQRFLHGHSLRRVAHDLGVPLETVRTRQRRALRAMRFAIKRGEAK